MLFASLLQRPWQRTLFSMRTPQGIHKETNPHNALPMIQAHGDREVWLNPPPIPLETEELDWVFELPYKGYRILPMATLQSLRWR